MSKKKKKAPTTKKLAATNKELKETLSGVRRELTKTKAKLTKTTAKAKRWKGEAATQRRDASRSAARALRLQKKLDRAAAAVEPTQGAEPTAQQALELTAAPASATAAADAVPDETWSVVQLKAEARARGLVGMSNKPKAQLLAALS